MEIDWIDCLLAAGLFGAVLGWLEGVVGVCGGAASDSALYALSLSPVSTSNMVLRDPGAGGVDLRIGRRNAEWRL